MRGSALCLCVFSPMNLLTVWAEMGKSATTVDQPGTGRVTLRLAGTFWK